MRRKWTGGGGGGLGMPVAVGVEVGPPGGGRHGRGGRVAGLCLVILGGGGAGMHWEGGEITSPPSRAPSLCPATVPLTPSAGFDGICNRQ